jgi:hypothetical protein
MNDTGKKYDPVSFIERNRFAPGDIDKARADAVRIARYLKDRYGASVFGVGSAFEEIRPFTRTSDIDLVARGLPAKRFFQILAEIDPMSDFEVNLIPWEDTNRLLREIVAEHGVEL